MIWAWLAKMSAPLLIALACLAAISGSAFGGIWMLDRLIDKATAAVRAERDQYWQGQIEKANAATDRQAADQMREVLRIQSTTSALIQAAQDDLENRKRESASLPDGDRCGLSAGRVRLLPD